MEHDMKTLLLTLIFAASTSLFAQTGTGMKAQAENDLQTAVESYEYCLQHDNAGVVESTLANVVRFKLVNPEYDTEALSDDLVSLAQNGETESLRFKAFLANQFLNSGQLLSQLNDQEFDEDEHLFKTLAVQMQNELLTSR